ncbi:hypothetical protein D3C71_1283330 [compost metagenome]
MNWFLFASVLVWSAAFAGLVGAVGGLFFGVDPVDDNGGKPAFIVAGVSAVVLVLAVATIAGAGMYG